MHSPERCALCPTLLTRWAGIFRALCIRRWPLLLIWPLRLLGLLLGCGALTGFLADRSTGHYTVTSAMTAALRESLTVPGVTSASCAVSWLSGGGASSRPVMTDTRVRFLRSLDTIDGSSSRTPYLQLRPLLLHLEPLPPSPPGNSTQEQTPIISERQC